MVHDDGIEPPSLGCKPSVIPFYQSCNWSPRTRIELSPIAYKAIVLPLTPQGHLIFYF